MLGAVLASALRQLGHNPPALCTCPVPGNKHVLFHPSLCLFDPHSQTCPQSAPYMVHCSRYLSGMFTKPLSVEGRAKTTCSHFLWDRWATWDPRRQQVIYVSITPTCPLSTSSSQHPQGLHPSLRWWWAKLCGWLGGRELGASQLEPQLRQRGGGWDGECSLFLLFVMVMYLT